MTSLYRRAAVAALAFHGVFCPGSPAQGQPGSVVDPSLGAGTDAGAESAAPGADGQPEPQGQDATAPQIAGLGTSEPPVSTDASCPDGWEHRAYRHAVDSVVRIKTPSGVGAGFLFEDDRTVVTALHVVEDGRWVTVIARTGESLRARVVHNATSDLDLAVLELERPFAKRPGIPLQRSPWKPEVSTPVMMIGHPGYSADGWSVSWGRIGSEVIEGAIEVDGTANPGNSGGPLLDCEGRVLGVVSYLKAQGVTMSVPISALPPRGQRNFHEYRGAVGGAVRLPNVVGTWEDQRSLWGVGLGADLVLQGRWVTALQGHYQWGRDDPAGPVIQRTQHRWQFELGQEFRIHGPGYLGLGVGGTLTLDRHQVVTGRLAEDTGEFRASHDSDRSLRARPMGTLSWQLGRLYLGYAYQLDLIRPELSSHRLLLGLRHEETFVYE